MTVPQKQESNPFIARSLGLVPSQAPPLPSVRPAQAMQLKAPSKETISKS